MRWLVLCLSLLALPASAQDRAQTLADIKAELALLRSDFDSLKTELVQSGGAASGAAGGNALQRLDSIEAELARVTAIAEQIELKVNRVVADGSNRLGDLEFRLCEQTEGCDPGNIPEQAPIGGGAIGGGAAAPAATPTAPAAGGPELAIGEKSDFDRAKGVLGQGDFRAAADLFAAFTQSYPGSPLTQEAQFNRGEALTGLGQTADASRAYLDAFSGQPDGPFAAESLLKLGQGLGALGQTQDACVTLDEVGNRFAGSISATNAQVSMQGLGCQ